MPKRVFFQCSALLTLLLLSSFCGISYAEDRGKIAIIIDDLGYAKRAGERAMRLPGPVAIAILPEAPASQYFVSLAEQYQKEVLLHLPLQALAIDAPNEPGSLTLDMTEAQFRTAVRESLAAVPNAIGVNNHMGSLLTRHPGHMRWLMSQLACASNLFFVDSVTTEQSVALEIARDHKLPAMRRHIFLDANPAPDAISQQFERLKLRAKQRGHAIAIGHPYESTLDFLEIALRQLDTERFELVPLSEMIAQYGHNAHPAQNSSAP